MEDVNKLKKKIKVLKAKLERKALVKGMYENFGQKEYSQLEDKIDVADRYNSKISELLHEFDNWCMDYTLGRR